MESYVEITFLHNILVLAVCLTLASLMTYQGMNKKRFFKILLMLTFFQSFVFLPVQSWVWINEIIVFLFFFKYRTHQYLLFIGFRFLFHLLYILCFDGTIYHCQFFVFDVQGVMSADLILAGFYFIVLFRGKTILAEKQFIREFEINHKKYRGYLDSGNLVTYETRPVIFLKREIYEQLNGNKVILPICHVSGESRVEGKKENMKIENKAVAVICCQIEDEYPYDALLNMKGMV